MGRQDYNRMAEAYARYRQPHPDVIEALIAQGGIGAGSRVLEIGCGTGNYILTIAARTGAFCTGVDPSSEMMRRARRQTGWPKDREERPEVAFIRAAAEDLPLSDRQFDLVYSVDVIHHLEDRDEAAREMLRVLQPGGMAMVVTESEDDLRQRTPHVTYFPDIVEVELQRYPSIETIQQELAAAGLAVGETIAVSRPVEVDDIAQFRDRAYSSLHLIGEDAFRTGLERMMADLREGPLAGERRYTIVTARRPESS